MSQICRKQDIASSWDTWEEKEMIKEFVKNIVKIKTKQQQPSNWKLPRERLGDYWGKLSVCILI